MSTATITLSNNRQMPIIGLGTWRASPAEVIAAVRRAVKAGLRLINTTAANQNEEAIGIAIKELMEEGVVKRHELFITTTAWANDLAPHNLVHRLRRSLEKLQLDYVDLYLAHIPTALNDDISQQFDTSIEDVWRQFDGVYRDGLARSIGVSNWNIDQMERALALGVTPIHNSQIELHLYFPQHEHVEYCKARNISITSYDTLGGAGSPLRPPACRGLGSALVPAALENANVIALAKKTRKTPIQVLLRYVLQRGVAIIMKSVDGTCIKENLRIFDFWISQEDMAKFYQCPSNRQFYLLEITPSASISHLGLVNEVSKKRWHRNNNSPNVANRSDAEHFEILKNEYRKHIEKMNRIATLSDPEREQICPLLLELYKVNNVMSDMSMLFNHPREFDSNVRNTLKHLERRRNACVGLSDDKTKFASAFMVLKYFIEVERLERSKGELMHIQYKLNTLNIDDYVAFEAKMIEELIGSE